MSKVKTKEFRSQAPEELEAILQDLKKEIYALNNEWIQTKKLEQPHQIRSKRRDVARVLTILREKKNKVEE